MVCVLVQVQQSAQDPCFLVATYEGTHNHPGPHASGSSTVKLDLVQGGIGPLEDKKERGTIQEVLMQQMASSLTNDPKFTAALAAAISGRLVEQSRTWNFCNIYIYIFFFFLVYSSSRLNERGFGLYIGSTIYFSTKTIYMEPKLSLFICFWQ